MPTAQQHTKAIAVPELILAVVIFFRAAKF